MLLSIVTPIYNERENIPFLLERLMAVLPTLGHPFELIMVNDGSQDGSLEILRQQAKLHPWIKVVSFRRNCGQTAAIQAGIDYASGDVIVTIDADLQNDPQDIPRLLDKLDEGYDVVSGWRKARQDSAISRNWISRIANRLISRISGVPLHDYGCTLKAYRSDVVKQVRLYGEMHRFIPIYASWLGARVTELPVTHHHRKFGKSNYGLERVVKVILDLLVVKFLDRYYIKPIYVFGGVGIMCILASFIIVAVMLWLKFSQNVSMILTPLPLLAGTTFLLGFVCILLGLIAEMLVRTYFESQDRRAYSVRELINFESEKH
jgi:glycosyltransferase involved in cell wall biosynthesis